MSSLSTDFRRSHHAEQALILYRNLYSDPKYPPTEEQRQSQEDLIRGAELVLEQAMEDARSFPQKPTSRKIDGLLLPVEPVRPEARGAKSMPDGRTKKRSY